MRTAVILGLLLVTLVACSGPLDDLQRAIVIEESSGSDVVAQENSGSDNIINDAGVEDDKFENTKLFPIKISESTFGFVGYAPGKSHEGSFTDWSGEVIVDKATNEVIGAEVVFNMDSVTTGIQSLDDHLKSDDFFDVENYPEARFELTSLEDNLAKGKLTFKGVTKDLEFEVIEENGFLSSDFIIDFSEFGMSYPGVNDEVRVFFKITY